MSAKNYLSFVLLAAAAACAAPKPVAKTAPQPTAPADPTIAFRAQFSNPGGMWMPQQMTLPQHAELFQKLGVAFPSAQLADPLAAPLGAVISLGGCTGSFVSPDGLVVTNNHCVQGALQLNSTPQANLVENGFLAKTRADEKSAGPAQRVYVAQAFTDVTARVQDGLDKVADAVVRKDEVDKRTKEIIAECEKDRPGLRCQVSGYFRGGQYVLIENLEIRDVRLVYVPNRGVGNFGGEIDNWAWPRHTGDFSFYRAYVGKDGKPADFSPDNIPYKPKHYLRIAQTPLAVGDFVMITGYPGTTNRTQTAAETHHDVDWFYPYYIAYLKQRYEIATAHLGDAGETGIKSGVEKQRVQNGLEKNEGVLKGLTSGDLLKQKDELEAKIDAWAVTHAEHQAAIAKVKAIVAERNQTARVDFDRNVAFGGSRLLATALQLTRWAEERAKPDAARKPNYQDRDMARALAAQKQFKKQYDQTLDRAQFRLALVRALALPVADRAWLATLLGTKRKTAITEATIDAALDAWYKTQKLEDEALRTKLLQTGTSAELAKETDPFLKAALRIWPIFKAEEKKTDARAGELILYGRFYTDAMKSVLGGLLAPDANSTLRITYGTVRGFKPGSTAPVDSPFTTAAQIPAKATGKTPFNAPLAELDAIKAKKYGRYADPKLGGELPVDFLSDLDITGGNSGSPTLNAKGELVGLAFDGTIEGVASDVVWNGATTRTIQVDARYMMWMMDALDGADQLLVEMGITPSL